MSVKYEYSESLQVLVEDISRRLFPRVLTSRIKCFRSSNSKDTSYAKCHALGKIMQFALNCEGIYVLEFVRENFDNLSTEEKVKVVIFQLMNISEKFGSGFRCDDFVNLNRVQIAYEKYLECRKNDSRIDFFKGV
jgi:predicted metallopeptidase